jgi:hypothetical protein
MKTILQKLTKAVIGSAIVALGFNSDLHAQAWQWATKGGGAASDVGAKTCTDPSGNVFVAGYFSSTSINIGTVTINNSGISGSDGYVAKYNSAGVLQWTQRIGGSASEYITGICCDNTGRVYVYGNYNSSLISLPPYTWGNPGSGTYNVYLACIDGAGVPQWLNGYGGTGSENSGRCAYSTSLSSIYIVGTYFDPTLTIGTTTLNNTSAAGKAETFFARFNNSGTLVWARSTGSSGCDDWGTAIALDPAGNPCILGNFSGSVLTPTTVIGTTSLVSYGQQDIYVTKWNNSGGFQWAKNLGSNGGGDYPGGIQVDASSNIYISGYFQGANLVAGTFSLSTYGGYDAFVAKYNTAGTAQWANKIGGSLDDYGYDLAIDANANVYFGGTFSGTVITVGTTTLANTSPGASTDAMVAKYNSSGTFVWANKSAGAGTEWTNGVASDAVGNVYVTGSFDGNTGFGTTTLSTSGNIDMFLSKIGCLTTSVTGTGTNVCTGSSGTLTASGSTTFTWSTGGTGATQIVTPTITTVYTVAATAGACIGTPASYTVNLLPASLSAGSNLNMLCKQKSVINATCNPASPASVVWSPATNLSSTSVLNPTVTAGSPITYSVSVTLSNGCMKSGTVNVSSYAQTPDICQVTVDSLGNNNEIYWEKTLYPQADSFIVYREVSASTYSRIAGISRTAFSMYVDTNRSVGPFNGDPNLTYYRYKIQIKDSCGNISPMSKWHETIFVQDQLNGNFNWNSYAIELSASPVTSYNLKRRDVSTGTETLVVSTGGNLATDPNYNTLWPTNIKWFVDAVGFNCVPSIVKPPKNGIEIAVTKTKTKSNQSNDKLSMTGISTKELSSAVKVYPNPATDVLYIDLNALAKTEMEVEIQNVIGQTVYQTGSMNQVLVINTNTFGKGIYFVNIKQNQKIVAVKKVVVD